VTEWAKGNPGAGAVLSPLPQGFRLETERILPWAKPRLAPQWLMGYSVLVHAAVQFGSGVGIDFANAAVSLGVRPCGEGFNIQLRPVDELQEVCRGLGRE